MQEGGHHSCRIVVAIAILNAFAQFPRTQHRQREQKVRTPYSMRYHKNKKERVALAHKSGIGKVAETRRKKNR